MMTSNNFHQPCRIGVFLSVSSFLELLFPIDHESMELWALSKFCFAHTSLHREHNHLKKKAAGFWGSINSLHVRKSPREHGGMVEGGGHVSQWVSGVVPGLI